MRVHLQALGCRLNEAELEQWGQAFRRAGHGLAQDMHDAELMVLNTCAVTGEAVRKSRQLINRLHRDNPSAKFVVTGCHATLSPSEVAESLGVDLVVGNEDKDRLVALVSEQLDLPTEPEIATEPGEVTLFGRGRSRAFVKVQDGCRYRCTYCIVTVARGQERSRPIADVLDEINRLYDQGLQEVVITGVQVGGYGNDSGSSLTDLLKAIIAETDMPRIRLGSVEPWSIDDRFFNLLAEPRFMPHLHLPLQSGSDTVLRRMSRKTRVQEFKTLVQTLRAANPRFNLTSDIIVGFPGETDDEWRQTMEAVDQIGFGHLHIFSYSDREGTKAASLPDKIPLEIKRRRSRELHDLAARMKSDALSGMIGTEDQVLWEGRESVGDNAEALRFGYTRNFHRVAMPARLLPEEGSVIGNTRLVALNDERDQLLGEPV
ncbi:MAG: tRNA (N(6)-L-threonylcarbamoyladenosine(37)-C(2))-methylthiotransferase MtaB [Gammaproteobacteria bacterium]